MTTSGHDIGWIREYNKEDILILIDTAKNVKGTIIHSEPFIWHGGISFNGIIHYSVHVISSFFHCKLADNWQCYKNKHSEDVPDHVCTLS